MTSLKKTSLKAKLLFSAFMVGLLTTLITPIIAAADTMVDYENLPSELYEHIIVQNGFNKILRSIEFGILKFLAKGINEFDNVLHEILTFKFEDVIGLEGIENTLFSNNVVKMVFTIFLVLGACSLMIFKSKIKVNDFFVGIIVSLIMIRTVPILTEHMDTLRTKGIKEINSVSYNSSNSNNKSKNNTYYYSLGDEILSDRIIDVRTSGMSSTGNVGNQGYKKSGVERRLYYYSEDKSRVPDSVFYIDYNATLLNSEGYFDQKVSSTTVEGTTQKTTKDLTPMDMMKMLGLEHEYATLRLAWNNKSYDDVLINNSYLTDNLADYEASKYTKPAYMKYNDYYQMVWLKTERALMERGASLLDVISATITAGQKNSFEAILEPFRDTIFAKELYERNRLEVSINNVKRNYSTQKLVNEKDYEEMDTTDKLGQRISTLNEPVEYIYAYDVDFIAAFILLLTTLLALIFACLKLGTVIFDLIFIRLVGQLFIASDQNNNGRAKKVFQEIISSYLIFLICALLINIYIITSAHIIKSNNFSYVTKIILIIAFAKGTIDGPDFITRVLGKDAGVKSGAATVMAISSGMNMATNAARTATGAAKMAARPATKVAKFGGKAAITGGRSAAGSVAGSVGGAYQGFTNALSTAQNNNEHGLGTAVNAIGGGIGGAFAGAASGAKAGATGETLGTSLRSGAETGAKVGSALGDTVGNNFSSAKSAIKSGFKNKLGGIADGIKNPSGAGTAPAPQSTVSSSGGSSQGTAPAPEPVQSTDTSSSATATSPITSSAAPDSSSSSGTAEAPDNNTFVIQGEKGEKGDKGDKGDTGNRGAQGENGKDAADSRAQGTATAPEPAQSTTSDFAGTYADTQRAEEQTSTGYRNNLDSGSDWAATERAREQSSYAPPPPSAPHQTGNAFSRPAEPPQSGHNAPREQFGGGVTNYSPAPQSGSQGRSEPPAPPRSPSGGKADNP